MSPDRSDFPTSTRGPRGQRRRYDLGVDLGAPELLIILVVALLIFGPSQLPKLSRSAGQAVREFRRASDGSGSKTGDGHDS